MKLDILFNDKPKQWGLRGAPLLWDDISKKLSGTNMPSSKEELESLLIKTFELLTESSINSEKTMYIEKYKKFGMSSGVISFDYWREKGIPLLVNRYEEI